jgi:hypothetical protein
LHLFDSDARQHRGCYESTQAADGRQPRRRDVAKNEHDWRVPPDPDEYRPRGVYA